MRSLDTTESLSHLPLPLQLCLLLLILFLLPLVAGAPLAQSPSEYVHPLRGSGGPLTPRGRCLRPGPGARLPPAVALGLSALGAPLPLPVFVPGPGPAALLAVFSPAALRALGAGGAATPRAAHSFRSSALRETLHETPRRGTAGRPEQL